MHTQHQFTRENLKLVTDYFGNQSNVTYLKKYIRRRLYVMGLLQDMADDISGDVQMLAVEHAGKAQFPSERAFYAWIFRIAKNRVSDYAKRAERKYIVSSLDGDFDFYYGNNAKPEYRISDKPPSPLDLMILREDRDKDKEKLKKALMQMPSLRSATVMYAWYFEGMELIDISNLFDEPLNSISRRFNNGIMELREILSNN